MYFRRLILNFLGLPSLVSEMKILNEGEDCAICGAVRPNHFVMSPTTLWSFYEVVIGR